MSFRFRIQQLDHLAAKTLCETGETPLSDTLLEAQPHP